MSNPTIFEVSVAEKEQITKSNPMDATIRSFIRDLRVNHIVQIIRYHDDHSYEHDCLHYLIGFEDACRTMGILRK